MSIVRTRYAPSPTGVLNIGGARTALFNYLFAKGQGGLFVVRIEDTDLERSDKKYEKDIFDSLNWLGIHADESPESGGSYGPYRQSERIETYQTRITELLRTAQAFYCFHSEAELEREKQELRQAKRPVLHLCEYRAMSPQEAMAVRDAKPDHVIRFKTPAGKKIVFQDLIRGELSFESDLLGDFSIAKRADTPLYNFAVVVDDERMNISHVIRGEDHLSNTPKQLLLIEALGFAKPRYAHLPLILGTDRSKLSKRHAATGVTEYRKQGYLSEALFNFMALLGWSPGGNREVLSRKELIQEFSLQRVQKSGAIFDLVKLDWMNGEYIRKKSLADLVVLGKPYLKDFLQIPNSKFQSPNDYLEKIIPLEQPRLKKLSELPDRVDYFFLEPAYEKELLRWKQMSDAEIRASLEASQRLLEAHPDADAEEFEHLFLEQIGTGDKGRLLWPLRVALTGKRASPGPFEVLGVLGVSRAILRLEAARAKL